MKVLVINGHTKEGGFIDGALEIISSHLAARGVEIRPVRLHRLDIKDCRGCFKCLRTGVCPIRDDMEDLRAAMVAADGFVVGSPVRNGLTTACYKRFLERITYTLGFPLLLEDKYSLAVSCVGYLGGRGVNRKHLGLQDVFHCRLSDYMFFKVGIPSRMDPEEVRDRLERGADRFLSDLQHRPPRPLLGRLLFALDRAILKRVVLLPHPDTYAHVLCRWREKGYL